MINAFANEHVYTVELKRSKAIQLQGRHFHSLQAFTVDLRLLGTCTWALRFTSSLHRMLVDC